MPFEASINGSPSSLLISVLLFGIISVCESQAAAPAIYMLGDSLLGVGNNNCLPLSLAKADFPHNGVDFPAGKPTGRFSNGKNAADFLAEKVGLPTAPPYLSLLGKTVAAPVTGVSFASGGAGILDATDELFKQSISMRKQVECYAVVRDRLVQQLGSTGAQKHLSKSLFAIFVGSNDWFAYFNHVSIVSTQYTPNQYVNLMVFILKRLLKRMHYLGARKLVVIGVPMIGCCPIQRKQNITYECKAEVNYWAAKYNNALMFMLQGLKSNLSDINFSYFDTYGAMSNLIQEPDNMGFRR